MLSQFNTRDRGGAARQRGRAPDDFRATESIANNSGYRYRLFHSRTKSAFLDSHMYVSGWLLCCHEPKYPQVSLHQALSGPDQDDIFCQNLIHCSGR